MQITERGTLGPAFERRLAVALDRIVPPTPDLAGARYSAKMQLSSGRLWRLTPALVGIGAIAIMATSATVVTGSTNPAVWTQRAAITIKAVGHGPQSKPKPTQGTPSGQRSVPSRPNDSGGDHGQRSRHDRSDRSPRSGEDSDSRDSHHRAGGHDANSFRGFAVRSGHRWGPSSFRLWHV